MRIAPVLFVATVLASPAAATAQSLRIPTAVWMTAASADWTTTHMFLTRGMKEADPLVAWAQTPNGVVAAGIAEQSAGYWLAYRLLAQKHRKWFIVGLYGMAAYQSFLAARNLQHIQAIDGMRLYFHVNGLHR